MGASTGATQITGFEEGEGAKEMGVKECSRVRRGGGWERDREIFKRQRKLQEDRERVAKERV